MMSPKNVRITLHVQSEVEIKSILRKADLCEIVRKKLCFKEEDITLEQRDNISKKWEELPSKGANRNLMLEDGMELKLKKQIQVNIATIIYFTLHAYSLDVIMTCRIMLILIQRMTKQRYAFSYITQ